MIKLVVEGKVGDVSPGLTIQGLTDHSKKFGFYSKCSAKLTGKFKE